MAVSESDWDAGNVEDEVVSRGEDGGAAAISFLVGPKDFGYLLDYCEVVVVGGASKGFSVQPVFAMVARNSSQDDPWGEAEDVVDGSENKPASETHLFTPVQIHIEGLPWIVAGALLHQIAKAD